MLLGIDRVGDMDDDNDDATNQFTGSRSFSNEQQAGAQSADM